MTYDSLKRKDEILQDSLYTLADSKFSDSIIFQGGGALHFIYASPRYSGDVDFVDPTITQNIDNYLIDIEKIGEKYPINYVKIMPSGKGIRAKWGIEENLPVAKVEIEERSADEYQRSNSKFKLLVKSPSDIYTDKIFANMSRYNNRKETGSFPFKPNDFFDLIYITETLGIEPVSKERVLQRAKAYDQIQIVNSETIDNMINLIIDEKNHEFFRKCISKSMMPDVYKLLKFDKKFFDKVAGHFENYK